MAASLEALDDEAYRMRWRANGIPSPFPLTDLRPQGGTMAYDRDQATHEFTRWSESYDRSVLQWLLFGPSHRALIRRIRAVGGARPARVLDVGCGTGVFAGRIREALPNARVFGIDLVSDMLSKGAERWRR